MIYTPGTALVTLASNPIPKHHQTLDNKEEMMQNFLSALNDVSEVFFLCLSLNWSLPCMLINLVPHANCYMAIYSESDWIRTIGILYFIDLHFMIWGGVRNLGTAQLDNSVISPVTTWGCFVSPVVAGCFTTCLVQIVDVQAHRNLSTNMVSLAGELGSANPREGISNRK